MKKVTYTNSRGESLTFSGTYPWVLVSFDPGTPKTSLIQTKSPGQDGSTTHDVLLEDMSPSLQVGIRSASKADMERNKRKLYRVFNPKLSGTLTYFNGDTTYTVDCRVTDSPVPKDKISILQEFLINFDCDKPYWNEAENRIEVAEWIGDFEFPWEIPEEGVMMGHRLATLIFNAANEGDVPCGMKIEFTALGTVVNPYLLNVETQEYLKIKKTLSQGDKLVIDTTPGKKSVVLVADDGTETNVMNWFDLSSTFLQLEVGDNMFRYNADSGIDNLDCVVYYTTKYVGV